MILRFLALISLLVILSSCAEEGSSSEGSPSSSFSETGVEFYNKEFKVESNIDSARYLIKTTSSSQPSMNFLASALSGDSHGGAAYALNSSDQIVNLFTPFNSGELKDISKKGGSTILVGEFIKGSVTCLVLVSGDLYSNCLVAKQDTISSIGATFINNESSVALLIENSNTGKKELYLYNTSDGFNGVNSVYPRFIKPLDFDLTGSIADSYSSNDYAAFYIKNGNEGEILFVKNDGPPETKIETVTSDSVQNIDGEPIFMSNGNLREGWSNSIYYKESSNNRTISDSGVLVSHKDAFFQVYYQSDYTTLNKAQELAYSNPMLFYLKPKRKDLPQSYPSFTLEPISCCKSLNNPSGTRGLVNQISWKKAAGFKKYALAYGEIVSSDYYEYESDTSKVINIPKAIILVNGDSKELDGNGNYQMSAISLYDYNNTSSEEDNLIKPLSYDTVSNIETYKNGFKITGTWALNSSDQRIVFYNPSTGNIETPLTDDQQTFIIKERI